MTDCVDTFNKTQGSKCTEANRNEVLVREIIVIIVPVREIIVIIVFVREIIVMIVPDRELC